MYLKKLLFLSLIICLLGGCVSLRPDTTSVAFQKIPWPERQAQLHTVKAWSINGAVSIQQHKKTTLANANWQQQARHHYSILLTGPLSMGGAKLVGRSSGVTLIQANGNTYHGKTPEVLMQQRLGWQMPVSQLYYWVRGLPAPGHVNGVTFDQYEHLNQLVQYGWHIHYRQYTHVRGIDLPSLITLSRSDVRITLAIKRWQL